MWKSFWLIHDLAWVELGGHCGCGFSHVSTSLRTWVFWTVSDSRTSPVILKTVSASSCQLQPYGLKGTRKPVRSPANPCITSTLISCQLWWWLVTNNLHNFAGFAFRRLSQCFLNPCLPGYIVLSLIKIKLFSIPIIDCLLFLSTGETLLQLLRLQQQTSWGLSQIVEDLLTVMKCSWAETAARPHPDFPGGSVVKNPPAKQETWVRSLGWEDPLEKEIATNSGTVNWVSKELNTNERVNNNSNRPYPLI